MKSNVLRGPLIKAAIVIVILSLLVFFTSSSPDGNVWSSFGSIVIVALRSVQWVIGMTIGLAVCLAVMIGIFLGAVSLSNPSAASRMLEGLRNNLRTMFAPVLGLLQSDNKDHLASALETFGRELKQELRTDLQQIQSGLSKAQDELGSTVSRLSQNVTALSETVASLPATEQVEAIAEEIKETAAAVSTVQGTVDTLKASVEQTGKQVQEISPEAILGELPSRLEALEQQKAPESAPAVDISPLEKSVATLQDKLNSVEKKAEEALQQTSATKKVTSAAKPAPKTAPKKTASQEKGAEEEHRIFSYFDDPADKQKVADIVASTLKKDLSYKQVMDLVAKEIGGKKGAIITSHPSLSKDYIRQCRRKA